MHDNWKHRSQGMRCRTCMYMVLKMPMQTQPTSNDPGVELKGELGRCRRHAPTMAGFPAVFETDWCGDHKLDENKI